MVTSDSISRLDLLLFQILSNECFRSKLVPERYGIDMQVMDAWNEVKDYIKFLESVEEKYYKTSASLSSK